MNGRRAMVSEATASRLARASDGRVAGCVAVDADGRVTHADPGAAALLGAAASDRAAVDRALADAGLLPVLGEGAGFRRSRDGRLEAALVPVDEGWKLV